jgi:hypothetical protein
LLRLDEELDLANAAAAELDIVPLNRDCVVAPIRMYLALHRMHVGDCREIEIFTPDERREVCEESLPGHEIARTGPRFDQRGTFPILSAAFVVVERGRGGDGDLS